MRVNVSELLADRDGVRVLAFAEPLPAPAEDVAFAEPVTGEIRLTGTPGGVSVRGRVHAVATCICGACLRRFQLPLDVDVTEEFGPRKTEPEANDAERELTAGDFLVPVEQGDTIDVTDVVRQHVLLALPLAPRCRDDCPGLCPRCGADLNNGPCGCASDDVDPRLEALRRWRAGEGQV
ncbi:MAG TPA: DUF177 domain-containing protein [bacterium]|nr:DUF177 domain-containing protein [bacterium]